VTDEALAGGNITHYVGRVGYTVRRSRTANSPYVGDVLRYLESVGFRYAPRYLGIDADGHDVLSYVPGYTTDHPSQRGQGAYAAAGRLLRELHDLTAEHPLARGGECVTHGDPGPYNAIFRAGLPVVLIDWDACGPGTRLHDLGYMSWTWCIQSAGNVPIHEQARHLRELRDAYGPIDGEHLLTAICAAQDGIARTEARVLENQHASATRHAHARRAIDWAESDKSLVQANWHVLHAALA
jgi:hypothetical protein